MNGGTKAGFSSIYLERLQCARRDSASPQKEEEEGGEHQYLLINQTIFLLVQKPKISVQI
jgi:hypothetical protein